MSNYINLLDIDADSKSILNILLKIDISDEIKKIIFKNIDKINKEEIVYIFDKYISKIEELKRKELSSKKEFDKKFLNYVVTTSRIKEKKDADLELEKSLELLMN